MRVKMILPALTEAKSPFFRPIKYSLFPPLGLAQLAGYFDPDDEIVLQDEHVETLDLDDDPELVVIQVYITSAYRSYQLADHCRRRGARDLAAGQGGLARRHDLPRAGRRAKRATNMLPVLEEVLSGFGQYRPRGAAKEATMETNVPTPIRLTLPVSASEEPSSLMG